MSSASVTSETSPAAVPESPPVSGLFAWGAVLGAVGWLYWPTLAGLPRVWEVDPNYSHGFVVPFASLAFALAAIWEGKRPVVQGVGREDVIRGSIRVLAGLLLHGLCLFLVVPLLDVLSLILVLQGALLILGGRPGLVAFGFPVGFLIFMAPLPTAIYQPVALWLQSLASIVSATVLDAVGVPVYRQGCYISIPDFDMEVGAACSGMRQLLAILALGMVVGYVSGRGATYRWILALVAIPVAVVANCIRVTMTGFILLWFGKKWAEGIYHTLEGMVVVALAAVLLLIFAWLLDAAMFGGKRGEPEAGDGEQGAGGREQSAGRAHQTPDTSPPTHQSTSPVCVKRRSALLVLLCGLALFGQFAVVGHLSTAMDLQPQGLRQPLDTVPLEIGEWRGRDQEIEEDHRYGDEHVSRVYGRPGGQVLSMWAAYSTTAEDRKHHPDVCMAVAGLREETSERATFEIPGHEAPVQQYRFSGASGSVWVFYWHYTLPTPGEEGLDKWQALYRNLNHRPASVTLEVFAPATNTSDVEAAREFVRQLDGIAQEIVGPDAERGSDRTPVTVVPGG